MRGRLSFALTALTSLFFLHGLAALLATSFVTFSDALYPSVRPLALLPALVPIAALFAPLLPVTRVVERRTVVAAAAVLTALARVPLSLPAHSVRLVAAAAVVAAGGVFLATAVGFVERRNVAGGVAAAVVLDQLLRLAGWSWDITLRTWWVVPQIVIAMIVALLAARWVGRRAPDPAQEESSLERRAGGLRLRGAVALGLLLFLDLNVLARAEVAARWLDVPYDAASVVLIAAGAVAALLLLAGHGPIGQRRATATLLAGAATAAAVAARMLDGWIGLLVLAAGHTCALLLVARTLVPAAGRRRGHALTTGLLLWLVANALYASTFYPSFTFETLGGAAPLLFASAGILLVLALALLPRPVTMRAPMRGRLAVALAFVLAVAAALLLALRQRPPHMDETAGDTLRVATFNVHQGFDGAWTYDPAHLVATIAAADPDVIALQEVGAALPIAYGTDLALFIGRSLGMTVHFAPTHNGLAGDAVLTRVRTTGEFAAPLLPSSTRDPRVLAHIAVPGGNDTVHVFATRLSVDARERREQVAALASVVHRANHGVLLGDLNAQSGSLPLLLLRGAGYHDVFALAGERASATYPSDAPAQRIDWILVRNMVVHEAFVAEQGGSDHRLVGAEIGGFAR